jgi:hypothetical protein
MGNKSILKIKIDNVRPGIGDQSVKCPLLGGDIYFEQCIRINQTIDDVLNQVLMGITTPEQILDSPSCANGLINPKLKKYAEKITELKKDWGLCKKTCSGCKSKATNSPIIGSVEVKRTSLNPIKRGA